MSDPDGHWPEATWERGSDETGGHNFLSFIYGIVVFVKKVLPLAVASVHSAKKQQKRQQRNYSVYSLNDSNGKPEYVGRTKDPIARKKAHRQDPNRKDLEFNIIVSDLNYSEARGLEQLGILACHTLNINDKKNNQINGISLKNPKGDQYIEATLGYIENQISNELLNLFEE